METAITASIPAAKTVNVLAAPAPGRTTTQIAFNPAWLPMKPKMLDLYARKSFLTKNPNPGTKNRALFYTHCFPRPNTDRDNTTGQKSTVEPNPNSEFQNPATPISNPPLSSSNSSFSRGLVFDLGPKSSWDDAEIGSPVIKRFLSDDEERWYMWYHGRSSENPGSDSIGLAVSSNGIHWERGGGTVKSNGDVGLVMNCSKDWWAFDTQSIRPSEVVIMSSAKVRANNAVYWLYYTGFTSEYIDFSQNSSKFTLMNPGIFEFNDCGKIYKSLPGLAMSQDGRHWARIEGEHHSGALLDVGADGDWDSLFIASPQVVFHGSGDLRMYYHSFDVEKGHFCIGIARSRDGIKWLKLGKILGGGPKGEFDELGVTKGRVVRNRRDGKYVMVYEGIAADGERSIGLAESLDGLKEWRRVRDGQPLLRRSEDGGWDNRGVGSPCLVQMVGEEDEWRLYYRGMGSKTGIGMAVSEGSEIRCLRRWTGFHL